MREIRLRAFAKINYALDVLGLRADGYHEVSTVMQSISLTDEVELCGAAGGFDMLLELGEVEIGPQERNTTYLSWKALQRLTGKELPVKLTLRKEIPAGAGLGLHLGRFGLGGRCRGDPHTASCATGPSPRRRQTAQECGYSRDLPGL
jgi:hypothetical protein